MSLKSIPKAPVLGFPHPLVIASSPTCKSRDEKVQTSVPASERVKPWPRGRALSSTHSQGEALKEPLGLLWFSGGNVQHPWALPMQPESHVSSSSLNC